MIAQRLSALEGFPALDRLKRIRFLGVIDAYCGRSPDVSNRYDHTIAVTHIAEQMGEQLGLSECDRYSLCLATLLHDIGHGPFSHSSEPFLKDRTHFYHAAHAVRLFHRPDSFSLDDISNLFTGLERPLDGITQVAELLRADPADKTLLWQILHNPLNPDKLEGNFRSAQFFNAARIPPEDLITYFFVHGGDVFFRWDGVDALIRYWRAESELYWKYLYTDEVFGAEAMLTRILNRCVAVGIHPNDVARATDEEVETFAAGDPLALEMLVDLKKRRIARSLRNERRELFTQVESRLQDAKGEPDEINAIEKEIAKKIGCEPEYVMCHFSRRKRFRDADEIEAELRQLDLFDNGVSSSVGIPLSRVSDVFSARKVSGDFFDVFYVQPKEAPLKSGN